VTLRRPALAFLAAVALAGCGGGDDDGDGDGAKSSSSGKTQTTRVEVVEQSGDGGRFNPQAIYEREAPGVVTVVSVFGEGGASPLEQDGGEGVGSGFVLNGAGEIATNAHVVTQGEGGAIRQANQVFVEFADSNQVEADIIGHDPNSDVALLRVKPGGLSLRPLPLGSSKDVQVGEPVAAIGSPFGERQSLSIGVVSAVDRSIQSLTNFQISGAIQTDAAINPGNSGGPLVNQSGQVIGINQQIKTRSGGGEGVGFAVPVDAVKHSLDLLRENGKVEYAYLGVSSVAIYPQLAERFDLPVRKGAWIQEITSDSPAADADLKGGSGQVRFQAHTFSPGGDVVTKLNGVPVEDADDLSQAVNRSRPGDEARLEVWRGDSKREVRVRFGKRPLNIRP
jgi:S1-C subfamily serine protease